MANPYTQQDAARPQRLLEMTPPATFIDRRTGEEFNPQIHGGFNRSGSARMSDQRVFGQGGQINASNNGEAFQQIQYVLDQARGNVSLATPDMGRSDGEWRQILAEALHDPTQEGFQIMGQELLGPVRTVIDYEGRARKVLGPRDVKQGEIVRYDLDVFITGWQIAQDAQTPECYSGGQYMYPNFFEVTAKPAVLLRDIYQMQYDVLARIQDRARQAIEYQEDRALRNLLFATSTSVNNLVSFANLNLAAVEALKYEVEKHRLVADKLLINRQELSDFVTQISGQVDPITQRELVMSGMVGTFDNMLVLVSAGTNTFEDIPPGECYVVTNSSFLGGMPIQVPLMSQPADLFIEGKPVRSWYWYELIAQVAFNPKAVARGARL